MLNPKDIRFVEVKCNDERFGDYTSIRGGWIWEKLSMIEEHWLKRNPEIVHHAKENIRRELWELLYGDLYGPVIKLFEEVRLGRRKPQYEGPDLELEDMVGKLLAMVRYPGVAADSEKAGKADKLP